MGLFGILTEKERNLVNKATTQERERIIKLLEDDYKSQDGIIYAEPHLQDLIELIKGETND